MKTIYKYVLDQNKMVNTFSVTKNYQILTVQVQNGAVCIWILIDLSEETIDVKFETFGTGWPIDKELKNYVGSVQDGSFVWHIFEV